MKIVKFEFALFGINTYLVFDAESKECIVIDPGMMDDEERKAIKSFIDKNNLILKGIINTHLHIDHAIGNSWLKSEYKVPIIAHTDDTVLGERMQNQATLFGLPAEVSQVKIDIPVKEGDVIPLGKGKLEVIHVPGHSPGSIALYDKEDGFIISGDTLFTNSIGRTDLPGGSYPTLIRSIKEKILRLPGDTIVYPGHGSPTTILHEIKNNPFLN